MKSLRKSILTLLALTLFGGAGAWAQGPTAAEINSDLYSGWSSIDGELFKASELPGFQAVTEDQAKSWTGVPSTGTVLLYYEFVADGHVKYVGFVNGVYAGSYEDNELERYLIYEDIAYNGETKFFYTTGGGAIELTKEGANQWSLGQAPDYDLELQVEYYEAHALKNIDTTLWRIQVEGVDKTSLVVGDSLLITETDNVTLIPAGNPRRVKSVTLEEVPSAVLVESITLNKTATTIPAGQTETLSVSSVTPDDATDQTVTWSSDNTDVATVGATTGEVTAVALGTANITATANDGSGVTATCAVTVSKVVTINQSDWGGMDPITKDGVTVSAGFIDCQDGNLMGGGTFSTTLGNFTRIVVTTHSCYASGTGWSGGGSSMTWAGTPASTVSFSGDFVGMETQTTIVCTIAPAN